MIQMNYFAPSELPGATLTVPFVESLRHFVTDMFDSDVYLVADDMTLSADDLVTAFRREGSSPSWFLVYSAADTNDDLKKLNHFVEHNLVLCLAEPLEDGRELLKESTYRAILLTMGLPVGLIEFARNLTVNQLFAAIDMCLKDPAMDCRDAFFLAM